MRRSVLMLLLVSLEMYCSGDSKTNVIPVTVDNYRTMVTVTIDRLRIPDIVLDTGFAFDGLMIYNPDYRDSLDLVNAMQVQIGGAGSGEASTALMMDSVHVGMGDITLKDQRLIVLQSDTYKGFPSNGIIGYSIFGHYMTEFDYDNNTLTLHDSSGFEIDNSWTEIPIYFKDNRIPWLQGVAVVISDETPIPVSTYIDYAAGDAIVLLEKPDMKFRLPDETVDIHIGRGLSGDIYGKSGRISKLFIGPFELKDIEASFAPAQVRSKQQNADAVLGNRALRRFNIIFDYAGERIFLKPNSHFTESPE